MDGPPTLFPCRRRVVQNVLQPAEGLDPESEGHHPAARFDAADILARNSVLCVMDISDGLAGDAHHIAKASHLSIEFDLTSEYFDPELMAKAVIQSVERHDHDSCSPITDYGLGTESMGSRVVIRDWEQTYVANYGVQSDTDVAKLKLPDPLRDGRMPVIIQCEQILVEKIENHFWLVDHIVDDLLRSTEIGSKR